LRINWYKYNILIFDEYLKWINFKFLTFDLIIILKITNILVNCYDSYFTLLLFCHSIINNLIFIYFSTIYSFLSIINSFIYPLINSFISQLTISFIYQLLTHLFINIILIYLIINHYLSHLVIHLSIHYFYYTFLDSIILWTIRGFKFFNTDTISAFTCSNTYLIIYSLPHHPTVSQ